MPDDHTTRPALRLLHGGDEPARTGPQVPDAVVEQAVVAVVVSSGGLPRRMLTVMVQAWLAIRRPDEELPGVAHILRSLGMCMVRGEVDADGSALIPGPAVTERAV